MKTSPTNKKIREIINLVQDNRIIPRPEFQRRLVWKISDKNFFLDSILKGYPFPEIYLADGEVDLETGHGTQLLVDGLQRVNTIIQYFTGDPDLKLLIVPKYIDLTDTEKHSFLQYDVAVRDLGSISKDQIVETFKRINATKYSLNEIEINNALYSGSLKTFCEELSQNSFFTDNPIFSAPDYRRMGELRYVLGLTITFMGGYTNRDDVFADYLERYNDDFRDEDYIKSRFFRTFDFISECGFDKDSRIWRKADLFTAIVEIDRNINIEGIDIQPIDTLERLELLFSHVSEGFNSERKIAEIYYKSAIQASNDRINRIRRGVIFSGVIKGMNDEAILQALEPRNF